MTPTTKGLLLGGCWAMLCAGQSASEQGITAFHQGRYSQARTHLQQAVQQQPSDALARTFLALTQAATGACAEALPQLEPTGVSADVQRLARLAYAQCQVQLGRPDLALPVLHRLQAERPTDADVLYALARLHMRAYNDTVQRLFEQAPSSYRVNQLSGEILEIDGKHAEAAAEYRKAIRKNPQALNLHYRLGRSLLLASHDPQLLDAARKEFEAELALNPEDAAAEYQVAQSLLAQGQREQAARRYERALALRPDFPEALLAVAKLRVQQQRLTDAITLLEKAVRLQPRNEAARYSLMLAYRNAGATEKARQQKEELDKLQRPQQGEFTDFLKRIGEKPATP